MKETNKPKEQFKDRLLAWSENNLGTKFSNLNPFQQSRQMLKFFILAVLEKLYPGLVPDDEGEMESSIIDGSGDGGADFLYRTDDGQVLIIQAKYHGKDAHESAEAVGRFCDIQERLLLGSQGKQNSLHKDLLDLAGQIDWENDTFRLYFITTGKSGDAVHDRVLQGISPTKAYPDLAEDRSELRYLDNSGLNQELREAISSSDFSDKNIEIPMMPDANGMPWCHFEGEQRDLYVGEVAGGILADILQAHKASLFTMNIRDYIGDSKTNKQIIETALNHPINFEYFNNGVTAVAGKIISDLPNHKLICSKMSIINGAQTVRSLLTATRKKGESQYKPLSLVRVIVRLMSFKYPDEVQFVSEVTKYNNTQNAVKIADFRSNDEVQKDISRRFNSLNLSGKRFDYKNKRSSKKRNTITVTMEELTKAIFAFRYGPDDFFGGTSKLFDSSSAGLYKQVFETPNCPLTESDFNLIAGTYFACSHIKTVWEDLKKKLRSNLGTMHPALERKGLIYFTVGEMERRSYDQENWDLNYDLSKLAKPNNWLVDTKSSQCLALAKAFDIASKILTQQYDARMKSDPSFKHRNWFREGRTLDDIRSGLDMALEFGHPPRIWS
jgi:hypothetical protein